jgi:hypothetical protein
MYACSRQGACDIFQRLFQGFSFRVAAWKLRATDDTPAAFGVGSNDDFEDNQVMIIIVMA